VGELLGAFNVATFENTEVGRCDCFHRSCSPKCCGYSTSPLAAPCSLCLCTTPRMMPPSGSASSPTATAPSSRQRSCSRAQRAWPGSRGTAAAGRMGTVILLAVAWTATAVAAAGGAHRQRRVGVGGFYWGGEGISVCRGGWVRVCGGSPGMGRGVLHTADPCSQKAAASQHFPPCPLRVCGCSQQAGRLCAAGGAGGAVPGAGVAPGGG